MNIFLTGATGFLGGRLIRNLLEEGHAVYLLARNIEKANNLKDGLPQSLQDRSLFSKGTSSKRISAFLRSSFLILIRRWIFSTILQHL